MKGSVLFNRRGVVVVLSFTLASLLFLGPQAHASSRYRESASANVSRRSTITVDATANIYGAGHEVPPDPGGGGGGDLPPVHEIPVGSGLILKFCRVTGSISADGGFTYNGPDGSGGPITVQSWDGISGIADAGGGFYLVGVFLTDEEPHDPAPPPYDFTARHDFRSIAPPLATVFFIGDGRTSEGKAQRFNVPEGATRLFLGLADACNGQGLPGCYGDNLGSLSATFHITPAREQPVT
jgi:hypothetical protein